MRCLRRLTRRPARTRARSRAGRDRRQARGRDPASRAENRARLRTLLSRITQDGTKIARIEVIALGSIETSETGFVFELAGPAEKYVLAFDAKATKGDDQPEQTYTAGTYKVRGIISSIEVGTRAVMGVTSIVIAEAAAE